LVSAASSLYHHFFYGKAEKMPEGLLPTLDVKEAIAFLEEKYYINFIVHAPKDYLVVYA